ncbi:hypothetical protein [Teichococcus vastitatis]|uniref:HNH endonuclease n=1 Tax=Teichococcus vastitatis TaxID=2307076 RepID=A0ABS9W8W6_9PROT|nr:hypothetical protein [Pseudoroseomonas vastitatis]MCI0755744.1 hypothetical protein [Pseudoroseomonas vastitatis]
MPIDPPTHRPQWMPRKATAREYDQARGSAAKPGYDADWRQLRARIIVARPICEAPGCGATERLKVDHVQFARHRTGGSARATCGCCASPATPPARRGSRGGGGPRPGACLPGCGQGWGVKFLVWMGVKTVLGSFLRGRDMSGTFSHGSRAQVLGTAIDRCPDPAGLQELKGNPGKHRRAAEAAPARVDCAVADRHSPDQTR